MDQVLTSYEVSYINKVLQRTELASLNTFKDSGINSRFMHFACNDELKEFYFITHKASDKVNEINMNPAATVSIISQGEKLADYCETTARGNIRIVNDINNTAARRALKYLSEKSAFAKMISDHGSLGDYVVLLLDVKQVVFRVYRDVVNNVPKTVIEF